MTSAVPAATARLRTTRARTGAKLVARRLAVVPVSLVAVALIAFLLVALIPQSTAVSIAGQGATKAQIAAVNHQLGLDQPIWIQFGRYVDRVVHGNLGTSYYDGKPVLSDLLAHVPATLELIIPALLAGLVLGIGFGTFAAYYAGRGADRTVQACMSVIQAMPEFLIGLLLIYLVFFELRLAPAPTGRLGITTFAPPQYTGFYTIDSLISGQWSTFRDAVAHLVLPTATIALPLAAVLSRITRAAAGDAFAGSHTEYARALGLPPARIVHYVLVDIRTTLLTFSAATFAGLIGGAAIVEVVFNWNGAGQWGLTAMLNLDVPAIQAFVLFVSAATFVVYLALDLLAISLDPRISLEAVK